MTNVHVSTDGDLLTIRVDLPAVAKALSNQAGSGNRLPNGRERSGNKVSGIWGKPKASIVRFEEAAGA
jgi:hypothetical protein